MAKKTSVGRRGFLKGAAAGAAALVSKPQAGIAQQVAQGRGGGRGGARQVIDRPGSDFMVDVLKTLNLEYVSTNPGSSFESLHESLINYGNNTMPEMLTCCHEESAVAMAHGYAKIEGKPMMALVHGTVGLQHASMAIYNAYADRVPVYIMVGNHADGAQRARAWSLSQRPGHGRAGARLREVGRSAVFAGAFRRVGRAGVQDCDDASDGAGADCGESRDSIERRRRPPPRGFRS